MTDFDDLDRRLMDALQLDASLSNDALAERVFTSPATALRRVRVLKASGAIERVVAILNPALVGRPIQAICEITLDRQNAEAFAAFEQLVAPEREVTQCYQTHPNVDYTLILTLRAMEDYDRLAQRVFSAANNVRNVRTRFATRRPKASFVLPL